MRFDHLYQFNDAGVQKFKELFLGKYSQKKVKLNADFNLLTDSRYSVPMINTKPFEVKQFATTKEMAIAIADSLGGRSSARQAIRNQKFLMWLTYALLDVICVKSGDFYKTAGEEVYVPPDAKNPNYQRDYRHRLFGVLRLYCDCGDDADLFLSYKPSVGGEVFGQVLASQENYSPNIIKLSTNLFFNPSTGQRSRRAGSKTGPRTARRFVKILKQLNVTWALPLMTAEQIRELLPAGEFGENSN